jgi:hypothetical protein
MCLPHLYNRNIHLFRDALAKREAEVETERDTIQQAIVAAERQGVEAAAVKVKEVEVASKRVEVEMAGQ